MACQWVAFANIALASIGALIAAYLAFSLMSGFFTDDGPLPLIAMLTVSLGGAFAVARLGSMLTQSTRRGGS